MDVIAGTLAGSGTIAGHVTVGDGAFLSPGNSPGGLTLESGLTLAGTYIWELGALSTANPGEDFGQITVNDGAVEILGASLGLNLGTNAPTPDEPFWQSSQTWASILQQTGVTTLTGTFSAIDNSPWAALGSFSTTYTGNDVNLLWTPVPEPSTALIGLVLAAGLLLRRRG